jgi:hypothetical protein
LYTPPVKPWKREADEACNLLRSNPKLVTGAKS